MDKEKGFFCVVYFILKTEDRKDKEGNVRTVITEGRTAYYHSQWNPSKLANALTQPILWMKIYLQKQDYKNNKDNFYKIFDKNNSVHEFTYAQFYGKYLK